MNRAAEGDQIAFGEGFTTEVMRSGVGAGAGDAPRQHERCAEYARSYGPWRGGWDGRGGRKFSLRMTETR